MSDPFLRFWNWCSAKKVATDRARYLLIDEHVRTEPQGNLYRRYGLVNRTVRYPDGSRRIVVAQKVRDTAGTVFYTFAESTRLS